MSAPQRCHYSCRTCAAFDSTGSQYATCTACDEGFAISADFKSCNVCTDGCKTCSSSAGCTACKPGYKLDSTKCVLIQCYPSCKVCSRSGTPATVGSFWYYPCDTCFDGHYKDANGVCQPCIEGCSDCNDGTTCNTDKCIKEYSFLTASTSCVQTICDPNCVDCLSTKVAETKYYMCNKCGPGTYSPTVGSHQCKSCIENCMECTSAAADKCTKCIEGYTTNSDNTKCVQLQCSSTCKNCDRTQLMPIPTDPKYFGCKDCRDGYFLKPAPSLECAACPTNCKTCSDANTCTTCNDGYITNADSKCVEIPCDKSCKTCDRSNPMPTALTATYYGCGSCPAGTYLDKTGTNKTFKCIACKPNCKECDATTCTACMAGYTYNVNDARCEQVLCSNTCKTCDRTQLMPSANNVKYYGCKTCPDGKFTDTTTYECLSCISNCKSCDNSNSCSACFDGYAYDTNAKICKEISCSSTCHTCDRSKLSTTTPQFYGCKTCPPKQFIDPNAAYVCSSCLAHCSSCNAGNTCLTCDAGYSLNVDNSACYPKKCDSTCSTCLATEVNIVGQTAFYTCQNCPNGMYHSTKYGCSSCQANCQSCTKGNVCAQCNDGYAYDDVNNVCLPVACSTTCSSCGQDNTFAAGLVAFQECAICPAQTYHNANGYECSPCMKGCDTCKDSVSCNACSSGYSLVSGKCIVGGSNARLLLEAGEVSAISSENSQTNTIGGVVGGVLGFSAIVTLGLLARYFFKKTGSNNQKKAQEQQSTDSQ